MKYGNPLVVFLTFLEVLCMKRGMKRAPLKRASGWGVAMKRAYETQGSKQGVKRLMKRGPRKAAQTAKRTKPNKKP